MSAEPIVTTSHIQVGGNILQHINISTSRTAEARRGAWAASGATGLILAATFGFIFALILTPAGILNGTATYWQSQVEDIGQYQSGFTAYVRAPWTFPLLSIPTINWPTGTVVTFVDAIPVLALVWKLLLGVFPMPHNPFGFWLAFCFVMQGIGAWYVMRQLRPGDWIALGLAVIFCVWMPSLAARMGHLSLQAHFILLFALGLYLKTRIEKTKQIRSWTALLLFAFYVNFYLTAMAIAIMFACSLDHYRQTKKKNILVLHAIPLVAIAASIPLFLGTAFGKAVPDTGFGFYSMNLLSPIAHGNLLAFPFYKPGAGQYEGYNYLGLGLVSGVVLALWLARRSVSEPAPAFGPFLLGVMGLFSIYSLSNEIYASDIHLMHWNVPTFLVPLFEAFRSSGRFFWPVSYALVFFVILQLAKLSRLKIAALAVPLVLLQAADLYPTFVTIKSSLIRPANQPADLPVWNAALAGIKTIHAFPKFKCNGALMREIMPLQVIAAEGGYNLTTGFISRYGADCDAISSEITASDPNTAAYVFTRAQFTDEQIRSYVPAGASCRQLDIWILCRKDQS